MTGLGEVRVLSLGEPRLPQIDAIVWRHFSIKRHQFGCF